MELRLNPSALLLAALAGFAPAVVRGQEAPAEDFALHGQMTLTDQGNLAFSAPYSGPNSLTPGAEGRETFDATLFVGVRPWRGGEIWINPEIDQGFGLRNTLGLAGFSSGEAYKIGRVDPYLRLQRLFLRQTFDLSGERSKVDADLNQLSGSQSANRVVVTVGRFGVTDVFDNNAYAHDTKHDFLNWALIDAGTFDYAADAWGYTVGAAAEWYQGPWTWRVGLFDLSNVPNSEKLDTRFAQFQLIGEVERRWSFTGKDGAMRITGFLSRGRMARFSEAIAEGQATDTTPDVAKVRRYGSRPGVSLDLQQDLGGGFGAFARAGWADGHMEPYEFADIDRTVSAGLSVHGRRWGRADDTVGVAGVVNGISKVHREYLADGGLGILIGDGRLDHYRSEDILEAWYSLGLREGVQLAFDYQVVDNPAYNADRGPVSIFAARLHAQF